MASAMAYEVDSGTTDAASSDAPSRPAAKSAGAAGFESGGARTTLTQHKRAYATQTY